VFFEFGKYVLVMMEFVILVFVLSLLISFVLGMWVVVCKDCVVDYIICVVVFIGLLMLLFWFVIVVFYVFFYKFGLFLNGGWMLIVYCLFDYIIGFYMVDVLLVGCIILFWDVVWYFVLLVVVFMVFIVLVFICFVCFVMFEVFD